MEIKGPLTMSAIWTEKELAERLELSIGKGGRSIQLSHWIVGGLRYAEKGGKRFFFENDIIEYLMKRRNMGSDDKMNGPGNGQE